MEIQIKNRKIGDDNHCFIIAELSTNHNQSLDLALRTIEAMAESGADAVKIQSYNPDSMVLNTNQPWFRSRDDSPWAGKKMYDIFKQGYTPWEWHPILQKKAEETGLIFFSSPFDLSFVDKLEKLDVPAYKIASLEITHIPLIKKVASTQKPVIISTGAATQEDIDLALQTCYSMGNHKVALLKCTSAYPTPLEEVNLLSINTLLEKYNTIVGLSDHTTDLTVPIGARSLGARIIEKHFMLHEDLDCLDKDFSLTPKQFQQMVQSVRDIEKALGEKKIKLTSRMKNATEYKRSLFAVSNIKKGEKMTRTNIGVLRPAKGLHPKYFEKVIGRIASKDIELGTPLSWELITESKDS